MIQRMKAAIVGNGVGQWRFGETITILMLFPGSGANISGFGCFSVGNY